MSNNLYTLILLEEFKSILSVDDREDKLSRFGIYRNLDWLIIYGSLPKYINDENITPLNMEEVRLCIEKLEQDIGYSLKNAVVCSAEFGTSIIIKEKPFEYLYLFGNIRRLTRAEFTKWTGVESINYISKTGSFEFIGYDKIKEMLDKKQIIPHLFDGSNVLRLEYKIRSRRGIKAKFNKDLTSYDLFDRDVYQKFKDLFSDFYKSIEKMGKLVYVNKSAKITIPLLNKLLAEQFRQSFPKDYRYFMQQQIENRNINSRTLERIRTENYKIGDNIQVLEQGSLIKELNALVQDRLMFGL